MWTAGAFTLFYNYSIGLHMIGVLPLNFVGFILIFPQLKQNYLVGNIRINFNTELYLVI